MVAFPLRFRAGGIGEELVSKANLCVQAMPAVYKIEMRHGEFTWLVKRKEKHFIDLHKELRTYKTFMKIPLPSRRYATVSRLLS